MSVWEHILDLERDSNAEFERAAKIMNWDDGRDMDMDVYVFIT